MSATEHAAARESEPVIAKDRCDAHLRARLGLERPREQSGEAGGSNLLASRYFARKGQSLKVCSSCDFWYGVKCSAAGACSAGFRLWTDVPCAVPCETVNGQQIRTAALRNEPPRT